MTLSQCLNQCLPRSLMQCCITRPEWVNLTFFWKHTLYLGLKLKKISFYLHAWKDLFISVSYSMYDYSKAILNKQDSGINYTGESIINTLRLRQNGCHCAENIFKCIKWKYLNFDQNSLQFVPKGPNNNIPELFQIMAWHRTGDKPLSEPMMA